MPRAALRSRRDIAALVSQAHGDRQRRGVGGQSVAGDPVDDAQGQLRPNAVKAATAAAILAHGASRDDLGCPGARFQPALHPEEGMPCHQVVGHVDRPARPTGQAAHRAVDPFGDAVVSVLHEAGDARGSASAEPGDVARLVGGHDRDADVSISSLYLRSRNLGGDLWHPRRSPHVCQPHGCHPTSRSRSRGLAARHRKRSEAIRMADTVAATASRASNEKCPALHSAAVIPPPAKAGMT